MLARLKRLFGYIISTLLIGILTGSIFYLSNVVARHFVVLSNESEYLYYTDFSECILSACLVLLIVFIGWRSGFWLVQKQFNSEGFKRRELLWWLVFMTFSFIVTILIFAAFSGATRLTGFIWKNVVIYYIGSFTNTLLQYYYIRRKKACA